MIALLLAMSLGQIDVRSDGGYVGRARDVIDCRGGLACSVDAGVAYLSAAGIGGGAGGGGGTSPVGLCGDGGSALGWDGGAYYCADVAKVGSCSAGQYITGISTTGAPTCSTPSAYSGSDFLHASLTTNYNTNLGNNDHIKFNTVLVSSGSSITLDTSTSYVNGNNVAAIGRFTVAAGTYRLRLDLGRSTIGTNGWSYVYWTDADTGTPFGPGASQVNVGTAMSSTGVETIRTFSGSTRVEARFVSVSGLSNVGENQTSQDGGSYKGHPSALIQRLY